MVALGSFDTDMYQCWYNLVQPIKVLIVTLRSTIVQPYLMLVRLFSA